MKKIYSFLALMVLAVATHAQVIPGGDMETWRTGTSHDGTYPVRTIHAPSGWYGFDSAIIYEGEYVATASFGTLGDGNAFYPQVFQESTIVHGGTSSAKLITVLQDPSTIGETGGAIANYHTDISVNVTAMTYSFFIHGGMPITGRIHSVSAWVQYHYLAGTIADTATMRVTAQKHFGTVDSTIGSCNVGIDSTSGGWTHITGYLFYNDEVTTPDTLRITFSSSISGSVDSSTLYVDDVTMTNVGLGFENTVAGANPLNIYPNPASGIVKIESVSSTPVKMELYSISGQVVASRTVTTQESIDVTTMPAGLYFYNVYDANGEILQKGKLDVVH